MDKNNKYGRLTIPTDVDIVPQTLEMASLWGADALRDADGTEFPPELQQADAKIYATYYTTRKDNAWAKANPDEIQQCYIMTSHQTATQTTLTINLMQGVSPELMQPNCNDDIARWWEVVDRTTNKPLPPDGWQYNAQSGTITILQAVPYHAYTVSFLAYLMWDPVHMYNATVNNWQEVEHQITFDVRQPKTKEYSKQRLRKFLQEKPYVKVVRFTTFFHQFTLVFDELRREKYVDWYGYSASVSPYILRQFEQEVGYPFRAEYIIDEGYYNNQYRIPSPEYLDFMAFQRREVAALAAELVQIVHQEGREAMMFLGDHWVGTEPYMPEFKTIGLDAVVGSVGNGATLRLISDIEGIKYTEGRFLPYFFPDTFYPGGNPLQQAQQNWVTARRAILRSPIDRIGYGGYLKLALGFPEFVEYVGQVADEFRALYTNVQGGSPYCHKTVAVLNCWGKMRSWGCHMVHHALYQKQNYSYAGLLEALSGAAFAVRFISFDDIRQNPAVLNDIDVLLNVGDAYTAHSGGACWQEEAVICAIRSYIQNGGGFIGVGEPTACQHGGRYFQLADALGVEKETGFTLGYDKYNWQNQPHFITADATGEIDFGEGKKSIYALPGAQVLVQRENEVQLAANSYGAGRCVYISGLPYSFENTRLLHRAIMWAANSEAQLHTWYSTNCAVEVNAYPASGKYCAVNNSNQTQQTNLFSSPGYSTPVVLAPYEIKWFSF